MSLVIALDSSPLGLLAHRKDNKDAEVCRRWLETLTTKGATIIVPAVADYEVRRELLRARKLTGIARLDAFLHANPERYLPPTAEAFAMAAELWASARRQGMPTAGDDALDADVLLAAQLLASRYARETLIVATSNPKHLSRFLDARDWKTIT